MDGAFFEGILAKSPRNAAGGRGNQNRSLLEAGMERSEGIGESRSVKNTGLRLHIGAQRLIAYASDVATQSDGSSGRSVAAKADFPVPAIGGEGDAERYAVFQQPGAEHARRCIGADLDDMQKHIRFRGGRRAGFHPVAAEVIFRFRIGFGGVREFPVAAG